MEKIFSNEAVQAFILWGLGLAVIWVGLYCLELLTKWERKQALRRADQLKRREREH